MTGQGSLGASDASASACSYLGPRGHQPTPSGPAGAGHLSRKAARLTIVPESLQRSLETVPWQEVWRPLLQLTSNSVHCLCQRQSQRSHLGGPVPRTHLGRPGPASSDSWPNLPHQISGSGTWLCTKSARALVQAQVLGPKTLPSSQAPGGLCRWSMDHPE